MTSESPDAALESLIGQIAARRKDWEAARRQYRRIQEAAPAFWPQLEAGLKQRGLLPPS